MSRKDLQRIIETEALRPSLDANLARIKEIGGDRKSVV